MDIIQKGDFMKKLGIIGWGMLGWLALSCAASCLYAADGPKIGVVDLQKVVSMSNYGKAALAEVNKKGESLTEDFKKKEKELQEIKTKIEREALVMSPEKREEQERDFRIKVGDLQSLEKKYKKELQELNLKLIGRIQNEVLEIVEDIGKKDNYTLILELREAGVMYTVDSIDLTDKIIKLYDEKFSKEKR
jgi:outer membrane protein